MAEAKADETERRSAAGKPHSRGVALADETPDELPALLTIAVGIAILAVAIVWPTIADRDSSEVTAGSGQVAAVDEESAGDQPAGQEPRETESGEGPDLELLASELAGLGLAGVDLSADGNVVTVRGAVVDEAARNQVLDHLAAGPNVERVVDELTIDTSVDGGPGVTVTAAQVSIVLAGTVPDQATEQALVQRAVEVYSDAQVDNRLVIDAAVGPPISVTIAGSMTDPVLYDRVTSAFDGIDGVETGELTITLEESGEVESSLNGLDPIEFASGTALIEPASEPILDQAAEFLIATPDVAVEIGGHTDSTGGEESNQNISQARADSVLAALRAREVTNELTAVGFGERRLKVNPDDNDPEGQRTNRRVEFRTTN